MNESGEHHGDIREFEIHDINNGSFFAEMHADKILFDHTIREWRIWDGRRWAKDERNQIQELGKETSRKIREMAEGTHDKDFRRQMNVAMSINGIRNMLISAQSLPQLSVGVADLDANPLLFNVRNGTLDLSTGTFREHRPSDRLTMVAGCDYDPEAEAPMFQQCLRTYWPEERGGDQEVREFLVRVLGYCLSGLNTEKCILLLHGTGDTGKTTLIKAVETAWGDYFRTADWSTFAQQRDGDGHRHRTDLVRLVGARIVSASEGDEGCRMSDGILKRITGRTKIIIRDLHSKPFPLDIGFKIFLDTNHLPYFNPQDRAMWNRLVQLFFRNVITAEAQRVFRKTYGDLDEVLAREAPGILNIALQGWNEYVQAGSLLIPPSVSLWTDDTRQQADTLSKFIEDCCELTEGKTEEKGVMYNMYKQWAQRNGEAEVSPKRFGMWMIQRGFREAKSGNFRKWIGIQIGHAC